MIVVKIEIWPHGSENGARELDRFIIGNNQGSKSSNYGDYDLIYKDNRYRDIVLNHNRKEPVLNLISKVLNNFLNRQ